MVIRSGSPLLFLAYFITLVVVLGLLTSAGMLVFGRARSSARVALGSLAAFALVYAATSAIFWLSPQHVVQRGDSYCWDLWCMGVENVHVTPRGADTLYTVDVRFFSDANTVATSLDGAVIYLQDDRGRRSPPINDPSVIPIGTPLQPRQSLNTSLSFLAPADASHLFLTGDAPLPDHIPLTWRFFKIYADLHVGYEKLSHRPTVLQVL